MADFLPPTKQKENQAQKICISVAIMKWSGGFLQQVMPKCTTILVAVGAEGIRRVHLASVRAKCAKIQKTWSNPKVQTLYHQRERQWDSSTISLTEDMKKTTYFNFVGKVWA